MKTHYDMIAIGAGSGGLSAPTRPARIWDQTTSDNPISVELHALVTKCGQGGDWTIGVR